MHIEGDDDKAVIETPETDTEEVETEDLDIDLSEGDVIDPDNSKDEEGAGDNDDDDDANGDDDKGGKKGSADNQSEDLHLDLSTDDDAEDDDNKLIRDFRKRERENKARIRELEKQVEAKKAEAKLPALKPKPKIEDFDYDEDEYDTALLKWNDAKAAHKRAADEAKKKQVTAQKEWEKDLSSYHQQRSELNVPDYEDAEGEVQNTLSETQQGIIVTAADNPAHLVLALGRNKKALAKLSEITDPIKFTAAMAKMEARMKVNGRKPKTTPEGKVKRAEGRKGSIGDKKLKQLEAEADKTGDRTKVQKYKREMAKKK